MRRAITLLGLLLLASGCYETQAVASLLATSGTPGAQAQTQNSSVCGSPFTLRGDVTGDGRPDRVTESARRAANDTCVSRLEIDVTGGASIGERLPPPAGEMRAIFLGLGPVDRRPGDEMLITLECGTACYPAVFTVKAGRILEEQLVGSRASFNYGGGTTSAYTNTWCNGTGGVGEQADGIPPSQWGKKRFRVDGRFDLFKADGTRFVHTRTTRRSRVLTLGQWEHGKDLPIPIGAPFARCITVPGQPAYG